MTIRKKHRVVVISDKPYTIPEVCKKMGVKANTINKRLKSGWDLYEAISTPVRARR